MRLSELVGTVLTVWGVSWALAQLSLSEVGVFECRRGHREGFWLKWVIWERLLNGI